LRSTGYAPSKTQKLTKNQPVFANGRESLTSSYVKKSRIFLAFNGFQCYLCGPFCAKKELFNLTF
jgi:hypothetical protein